MTKRKTIAMYEVLIALAGTAILIIMVSKIIVSGANTELVRYHKTNMKEVQLIQMLESALSNSSEIAFTKDDQGEDKVIFINNLETTLELYLKVNDVEDNGDIITVSSVIDRDIKLVLDIDKTTGMVGYKVNDTQLYCQMEVAL